MSEAKRTTRRLGERLQRLAPGAGAALIMVLTACGPNAPTLSYRAGVIVAEGWNGPAPEGGWESVLEVRASPDPRAPLMLGAYEQRGGAITFTPRFAPSPGVALHAMFHVNHRIVEATFGEPAKALAATTTLAHLYPSADAWPANTLKLYLTFSAPMARGEAYARIRVVDDQGKVIVQPFVEIEPELWDTTGTRLTILFDPGRIKRGLVDNEQSGPPLMPGRTVTIEVDAGWRDASGAPLKEGFARTVRVTPALRDPIDVKRWTIAPGARDLVVTFDRPMDQALAQRAISVTRDGARVGGTIRLEEDERVWRFIPDTPFATGGYYLAVEGVLEDLAGNRPGKLFDVDTADPGQATAAIPVSAVPFAVRDR